MSTQACPPPIRSRAYSSPPTAEQYKAGGAPGGFTNFQLNINPPRRTILLQGNDGGGAVAAVFLSFVPIQQNEATGEPVVGPNGTFKAFKFLPVSSAVTSPLAVTFRKRIGGVVYISSFDTGQPGSFDWFLATDDYAPIGIIPEQGE